MEIEKSGPITVLIQVLNHFLLVVSYIWEQSLYIARVGGGGGGVGRRIFEEGSHDFQGELRGISRTVGYRILTATRLPRRGRKYECCRVLGG